MVVMDDRVEVSAVLGQPAEETAILEPRSVLEEVETGGTRGRPSDEVGGNMVG